MTYSNKIIGVIPAGGQAKRISSFFKEMLPIAVDEDRRSKFIITSERIISDMLFAGADKVHFILHKKKKFIVEYYKDQNLFPEDKVLYSFLPQKIEPLGMPYTIDFEFNSYRNYDYVLLGLPDTVIEPQASFQAVLALLKNKKADLALGLFQASHNNNGGYIKFDNETKIVIKHIDHTFIKQFPQNVDNAWVIACWNKKFSEFMHDELIKTDNIRNIASKRGWTEVVFGDIIDLSILNSDMKVVADYLDKTKGFFWDITNPEKYFDLLRSYNIENGRFVPQNPYRHESPYNVEITTEKERKIKINQLKVFISYAKEDLEDANTLKKILRPLEREKKIKTWYDLDMISGDTWNNTVMEHLERADIFLFLVSINFMSKDYIWDKEIPRAIKKHKSRNARVIPIILSDCGWEDEFTTFGKFLALPYKGKPISSYDNKDYAWKKVFDGIKKVIDLLQNPSIAEKDW